MHSIILHLVPNLYSATRHAINGLTTNAARDWASKGIRINAVALGLIESDRFKMDPEYAKARLSEHPIGRFGRPEEVAEAVLFDYGIRIHFVLVNHKTLFTLIRYSRDQVNLFTFWVKSYFRCLAPRCIASTMVTIVTKTSFVTSMNFGFLFFCPVGNRRVFIVQPFFYGFGVLLVCASQRSLWSEAPPLQIVTNDSNRHVDRKEVFNQLLYGDACPKGERKLLLIQALITNYFLNFLFLVWSQSSERTQLTPSFFAANAFGPFFFISFQPSTNCYIMDTHDYSNILLTAVQTKLEYRIEPEC